MKKHNFLLLTFFSIVICSCNGMYDNINIYYDEGETNYIAKPDSVSTNAGINRVQIKWMVSTDPRIKDLKVTWDDGAKEAVVPIDFALLDENRYYTTILEGVEEGDHIFKLYHTGNGDTSIATEAEATSYGDQYQSSLTPRPIRSVALVDGKATITWKTLVENCDVEITYTNNEGTTTKMSAAPSELTTVLEDAKYGTTFTYVSTYLPEEGSIDVFSVVSEEIAVPKPDLSIFPVSVDVKGWSSSAAVFDWGTDVYTKAGDASFKGPDAIKLTYTDRDGVKVEDIFYSPWEAGVAANRGWVANLPENTTTTITANVIFAGLEGPDHTFEVKTKSRDERFYYGVDDPGYNGRYWFGTATKYSVAWQWVPIMGKRLGISQTWDTWKDRYTAFDSWYVAGRRDDLYKRLPNCKDIEDDFPSLTIYGNVTDLRDILSFINLEELTFAKAKDFLQTSNNGFAPATLDLRPLAKLKKLKTINVKDGTPLTNDAFEKAGVTGVTINIL